VGNQAERAHVTSQYEHPDAGPQKSNDSLQDPVNAQRIIAVLEDKCDRHVCVAELSLKKLQSFAMHPPVGQSEQGNRAWNLSRALKHQPQADQVTVRHIPGVWNYRRKAKAPLAADPVGVEGLACEFAALALVTLAVCQESCWIAPPLQILNDLKSVGSGYHEAAAGLPSHRGK
jgi:hypothetical protein